jgi:hypothetical protein
MVFRRDRFVEEIDEKMARDGETERTAMVLMDGADLGHHRPGFRVRRAGTAD